MIRTTTLDCGITVVTERMPDVRSVSAGFWVGTGSRDEPPALAGASHFLEHLLFKGTPTRSARRIAEDVDAVGGDMNAFTAKEHTAFYLRVLDESLELGLDILSDILWDPAFRPEEVESERQVILEEILMRADEPGDFVHEVFAEAVFATHPLGREVLGDEDRIQAMTPDDIRSFWAQHYRPGNIVFSAAGQLDHDALAAGVERRFAGERGGERPARTAPGDVVDAVTISPQSTEQAHLVLGVRALTQDDERRYALSVLDHVLGGGLSSRLFQSIREDRGLAYSVYSYRASYQDAGALSAYAGTAVENAPQVYELMNEEFDRLAASGITARELEVAKGHLKGELALSLEDSGSRMHRIGRNQLVHGRVVTVDEVVGRIDAVTLDEVAEVAADVLARPRALAVVGPFDDDAFANVRVA
jgi:predicted Zn-dependent peptidase